MTTKTLAEIERLARSGWCDAEIARRTGQTHKVAREWRIKLGLPIGKKGKKAAKTARRYTFYDRRTTRYLCEGTARECAEALGLKVNSVESIICRTRNGIRTKYEIYEVE